MLQKLKRRIQNQRQVQKKKEKIVLLIVENQRKKPGNDRLHLIQIIGEINAEFNTPIAKNYEKIGPNNKKWGGRNNISPTYVAMINLLAYESAWMNKDTSIMLNSHVMMEFDRMYNEFHAAAPSSKTSILDLWF